MNSTKALLLASCLLPHTAIASTFVYDFTELGLYLGEEGNFPASVSGDTYAVNGLRAAHVEKYQHWIAELGGNYGKNALDVGTEDQSFTELGVEAAVGRHLPLGDALEVAGFIGGNYRSLETLEFTSSDTYVFFRARASYAVTESIEMDLDYEIRTGDESDNKQATLVASWDNRRNLSAAVKYEINSGDNSANEAQLRLAYQTAPDLKFYLQHRSASHENTSTSIIELGARIVLGKGGETVDTTNRGTTPQERAERRRKAAEEALRKDLPASAR